MRPRPPRAPPPHLEVGAAEKRAPPTRVRYSRLPLRTGASPRWTHRSSKSPPLQLQTGTKNAFKEHKLIELEGTLKILLALYISKSKSHDNRTPYHRSDLLEVLSIFVVLLNVAKYVN